MDTYIGLCSLVLRKGFTIQAAILVLFGAFVHIIYCENSGGDVKSESYI